MDYDAALRLYILGTAPDDAENPVDVKAEAGAAVLVGNAFYDDLPSESHLLGFLPTLLSVGGCKGLAERQETIRKTFYIVRNLEFIPEQTRNEILNKLEDVGRIIARLEKGAAQVDALLTRYGWRFDAERGTIKDLPGLPMANRPAGLYTAAVRALYEIVTNGKDAGNTKAIREEIARRLPGSLPADLLDTRQGKPISNAIKNRVG